MNLSWLCEWWGHNWVKVGSSTKSTMLKCSRCDNEGWDIHE